MLIPPALGALLRDHVLVAGLVVTTVWLAGTIRGLQLVRMAERATCPLPAPTERG